VGKKGKEAKKAPPPKKLAKGETAKAIIWSEKDVDEA